MLHNRLATMRQQRCATYISFEALPQSAIGLAEFYQRFQ